MKKTLAILIMVMTLFTSVAGAANVGDKISEAVYSDLAVYINHHPIPSYVVNDYAVIVAEDLQNYCCDVVWNGENRTLDITRSAEKNTFTAPAVYKSTMPGGSHYADVLYTDIKTYVNGTEVTSFNINGRTMIVVDEFGAAMDGYTWDNNTRAAKAWIDGKPFCEFAPLSDRTKTLFRTELGHDPEIVNPYTTWYDFNFDGVNEPIKIQIDEPDYYNWEEQYMEVRIGEKVRRVATYEAVLDTVFVCDIDSTDGVKDLAVVTVEMSGDPVLRLFRYADGLPMYKFGYYSKWEQEYNILEEGLGLGYVDTPYLNVNDDGSITLKTQTKSNGMWYVNRTFVRDAYGTFMEVLQEQYAVLPDFMQNRWMQDQSIDGYEATMWEKGYIKAHQTYKSNGFTIQKGEYFKVLYDNDNDFIYVVKQNGKAGWISIAYDMPNRYELNEHFFYVAG